MTTQPHQRPAFTGITPGPLDNPDIAQRQAHYEQVLHPQLVALADLLYTHGERTLPKRWSLYTTSFKQQPRHPQPDQASSAYLVIDRPPRGGGIYVSIDGPAQQLVVALQLAPRLRDALRRLLAIDDQVAAQLATCTDVRFRGVNQGDTTAPWYERYVNQRRPSPLLCGFQRPLSDPEVATPAIGAWICGHVGTLLALHDAIIQHVIAPAPRIREASVVYDTAPALEVIVQRIAQSGVIMPESVIRQMHLSLQQRPFVILAGPPGVGKSLLARRYADALYGADSHGDNPAFLRVAVQPDWHHARDILGYYNALADVFQPTPLTRLLLEALRKPRQPFVVCLDEMNLARPEYYLAPILSASESVDRLIDLGIPGHQARLSDGESIPNPLPLARNILWIGTVNQDESTYDVTPRILDRMHLIDMPPVDLSAWRASWPHPIDTRQWQTVVTLQRSLTTVERPFGYRSLSDLWGIVAQADGPTQADALFDEQLRQRLSSRLKGQRSLALWQQIGAAVVDYPLTAQRITQLREQLQRSGFVQP